MSRLRLALAVLVVSAVALLAVVPTEPETEIETCREAATDDATAAYVQAVRNNSTGGEAFDRADRVARSADCWPAGAGWSA